MLVDGVTSSSSPLMAETAPVMDDFFCLPYPTTTTSSRFMALSCMTMSRVEDCPTLTSCVVMPT